MLCWGYSKLSGHCVLYHSVFSFFVAEEEARVYEEEVVLRREADIITWYQVLPGEDEEVGGNVIKKDGGD